MAKIGLSLKIDVSKIDKSHLYQGKKGVYLDASIFVDLENPDEYGNNGMIVQTGQKINKGEGNILGNGAIFWRDNQNQDSTKSQQPSQGNPSLSEPDFDFDDDFPF